MSADRRRMTTGIGTKPICWLLAVAWTAGLIPNALRATEPVPRALHAEIDQRIAASSDGPLAPPASDAEFVRRVFLDLAGRIPTRAEAARFLADSAPDKRTQLVDRLMSRAEFAPRMAQLFDVMLMERRGEHDEWLAFLTWCFTQNVPWDEMVRMMIAPDADDARTRGSAFFITKRLEKYGQNPTDYPGLVRDVGRMFLGIDVECAQCHDHLFIDEYDQQDYQGLYAFLGTAFIRQDTEFPAVAEKPLSDKVEFTSVFMLEPEATGPRVPGGFEIDLPEFDDDHEAYLVPPDRKTRFPGVLKFSPLRLLSEQLPTVSGRAFARNIANRMWWVMMGQGLVEPLDQHHIDNPPTHPFLMNRLADELVAHDYDLKWLLREMALSGTYQRSSQPGPLAGGAAEVPGDFRVARQRPLSAEQFLSSVRVALGYADADGDRTLDATRRADLLDAFRQALANPPKEPEIAFNPSVKAALFLMHDETILSWCRPEAGNLVAELAAESDPAVVCDALYLAILSRSPLAQERDTAMAYLEKAAQRRAAAIGNLAWALIASTEFAVNH